MSETKRPTSGMWVKCTKDYSSENELVICAKGEWYQLETAGNVTFSVKRDGGTSHFVWDTQHFDTTTARLKPPGKIPDIKVEPMKRKLEAGMWVKIRDGVLAFEESKPYREIVLHDAQLMIRLSSLSYAPLNYMVLNTIFDLDNPLTAEEAAMTAAPVVINSAEEAEQMYGGMPFLKIPSTLREPYKPHTDNVLQQANTLIYGDRQKAYGSVSTNFTNIAKGWSVILGTEVSAEQVGLCMAWLKIARQVNKPNIDNLIDAAGYVGCVEKVQKGL